MADLTRIALRRNPKRAQLLVSTVLGKHLPVDPRVVDGTGRLLGALVADAWPATPTARTDQQLVAGARASGVAVRIRARCSACCPAAGPGAGDVLTIGFAETATSLGHLVADQLGSAYLHSTRRRSGDVPVAAEFVESHSHATDHLLRPGPAVSLTEAGTAGAGRRRAVHRPDRAERHRGAARASPRGTGTCWPDWWTCDRPRTTTGARPSPRGCGCRIDVVSLVRGSVPSRPTRSNGSRPT